MTNKIGVRAAIVVLCGGLVFSVSACSSLFGPKYRDPSGQITASASIDSSTLQVGDCVLDVSDMGSQVGKVAVVPCSTPHEGEVYAVAKGQANDADSLSQFCQDAYQGYMGISWDDATLSATYIHSQSSSATTDVQCIVYNPGQQVTTSYKGSQQ